VTGGTRLAGASWLLIGDLRDLHRTSNLTSGHVRERPSETPLGGKGGKVRGGTAPSIERTFSRPTLLEEKRLLYTE
jgi:hypothetical protein